MSKINHYDSFFAGIMLMIVFFMIYIFYYENVLDINIFCLECYESFEVMGERLDKTWTGLLLLIPLSIIIMIVQWRWDKKIV